MVTHKALVIRAIKQPVTTIMRLTPVPGDDELLLKVSIVGLNPHDGSTKAYGVFIENTLPSPFGIDIVGTVTSKGKDVTKFNVGDCVFAFGNPFYPDYTGTQEYCVVPAWQASFIPSNVTADEAATFPLNTMTMVFALFHETGLNLDFLGEKTNYTSESILIVGGGSATGKFGIQLARLAKFGNIIVVASRSGEAELRKLGANHVIDRTLDEEEIERQIRLVVGDDLVYAVDCVGRAPDGQTLGARALSNSRKGTIATLVKRGGIDESRIGPKVLGFEKRQVLCLTMKYPDITKRFWKILPRLIEVGSLKPTTFQAVDGVDPARIDGFLDGYANGESFLKPHFHMDEKSWALLGL